MQKITQSNVLMARSSADQLVRWGYALSGLKLLSTFGRREVRQTAEVTPNGGFGRESPWKSLDSGLGIIVICPDTCWCDIYIIWL